MLNNLTFNEIKYRLIEIFAAQRCDANKNARLIYSYFLNNPKSSLEIASINLGLSVKTVWRHLHYLESKGLITIGKHWDHTLNHPVNTYEFWGIKADHKVRRMILGVLKGIKNSKALKKGTGIAKKIIAATLAYAAKSKQMSKLRSSFYSKKNKKKQTNVFINVFKKGDELMLSQTIDYLRKVDEWIKENEKEEWDEDFADSLISSVFKGSKKNC